MCETENEATCSQIKRKKRSANFTPNETILLMSLISDFRNIIENKKTDGVSVQQKNNAWKKITSAFNSACPEGRLRATESLKKLYDNKKRETRKEKSEERKEILLTGGGTTKKIIKDPAHELILSIVDPLSVVGGTSLYGSDSLPLPLNNNTSNNSNIDDYFTFELENPNEFNENVNINNENIIINNEDARNEQNHDASECNQTNWKKGSDLLRPISTPLCRPREELPLHNLDSNTNLDANKSRRPLNRRRPTETVIRSLASNQLAEKYNLLADKKNLIADYTLKKLKLDLEHSKEEHNLRTQTLKLDIEKKKLDIELKKQQLGLPSIQN